MDAHFRDRVRKRFHLPRFYRYVVGSPRWFRLGLNQYPHHTIGACVVVGRWAYCVKWADL
jgi:hypothetical protein